MYNQKLDLVEQWMSIFAKQSKELEKMFKELESMHKDMNKLSKQMETFRIKFK